MMLSVLLFLRLFCVSVFKEKVGRIECVLDDVCGLIFTVLCVYQVYGGIVNQKVLQDFISCFDDSGKHFCALV